MKNLTTVFLFCSLLFSGKTQVTKLDDVVLPDPRIANDYFKFGSAIAGVEGYAVISAPQAMSKGLVFLYEKQGGFWNLVAELSTSNSISNAQFGYSLAMDSNTVVVSFESGSISRPVYVYEKPLAGWSNMTETAILHASDSTADDAFGHSMVIKGNYLFVGAPKAKNGGQQKGAVYIYEKTGTNWTSGTEDRKILSPNAANGDQFGYAISVDGDNLLVGAPADSSSLTKGKAYLFEKSGNWTQGTLSHVELTASNGLPGDRFGNSVGILGDDVVIGAPEYDGTVPNSGLAYQFSKLPIGWTSSTETLILNPPTISGLYPRKYAEKLQLSSQYVAFGVPNEGLYHGGVFVHNKTVAAWSTTPNMSNTNTAAGSDFFDYLGQGILALENEILAGIPGGDDDLPDEGKVRHLVKNGIAWDANYTTNVLFAPEILGYREENFGQSIDLQGNIMVVGAPNHLYKGAVYVKEFDGINWNTLALLEASNGYISQGFGTLVKKDGDWIAVVSVGDNSDSSIIYMFKKPATGWSDATETCRFSFQNGSQNPQQVHAIDFQNGTLVLTSRTRKKAFIYEKGSGDWTSSHVPIAEISEQGSSSGYGYAVKLENDVIVLSDPFLTVNGSAETGRLYVYEKPSLGWVNMSNGIQLNFSTSDSCRRMGMALDMENGVIVAGSPYFANYLYGYQGGAGVVFKRSGSTWTSMTELALLRYIAVGTYFLGSSVAIEGDQIYLGGYYMGQPNTAHFTGGFMVFDKNFGSDWVNSFGREKVFGPPTSNFESFGTNMVVEGSRVVLGSPYRDSVGSNSGAVYVYETCYSGSRSSKLTCEPYTWIDGVTYTQTPNDLLEFRLTDMQGCDSVVLLDLSFYNLLANISDSNGTLVATPNGKQYAWMDCNTGQLLTSFSNDPSFEPQMEGTYAAVVMDGNCMDTSDCISYNQSGLEEFWGIEKIFQVYPNPNKGTFTIPLTRLKEIRLYTLEGKQVDFYLNENESSTELTLFTIEEGIYLLVAQTENGIQKTSKVVIKND